MAGLVSRICPAWGYIRWTVQGDNNFGGTACRQCDSDNANCVYTKIDVGGI